MATILIVDRPASRRPLVALLRGEGYRVLEAGDGATGLAITQSECPDLTIADFSMPTMNIYKFVRRLRTEPESANTRIISYTSAGTKRVHELTEKCRVCAVIQKPCAPEVLRETVKVLLAGPPARSPDRPDRIERRPRPAAGPTFADVRVQVLLEFGRQLGSERAPERLPQALCDAVRQITGARYAIVGTPGPWGHPCRLWTSGMSPRALDRFTRPDLPAGPLARALATGRCYRVSASCAKEFEAAGVPASFPVTSALLAAPFASPALTCGWVCVIDKRETGAFTDEDERLVEALAAQTGRTYETCRPAADGPERTSALRGRWGGSERRTSADRFRDMFEHATVASALTDLGHRCVHVNAAFARAFGYAPDELIGVALGDLVHPSDRAAVRARCAELVTGPDGPFVAEYRYLHRSGHTFGGQTHVSIVYGPNGQPLSFLGQIMDVTGRERAEEETRHASDLLRAVADGTSDAVFVKDRDGKYLFFNEAAAQFVGKSAAEVLGKDDAALFDPAGAALIMARDRRVLETGEVETEEETLTAAGATRTYHATKGPYRDAGGRVVGVIGVSRDITDRKRTEQRLTVQHAVVSILAQAHDLAEAAPRLLQAIGEAIGWDVGALWAAERTRAVLACVAVWPPKGGNAFLEASRHITMARDVGVLGRVWATGASAVIADTAHEPNFLRADAAVAAGLRTGVAVPIRFASETLGVAEFFSRKGRLPDAELLAVLDIIGSQIGQFVERKRVEGERHLFRALIDRSTDGIEVIDPATGRFLDVNERELLTHGYTRAEYLALTVADVDPAVAAQSWKKMSDDGRLVGTQSLESYHRRKDGSVFPVEVNFTTIALDRAYIVAVVRDITARRATEQQLRIRDRAIHAVTQGILITDPALPDNPIVYVTPGFERLTGYPAAEAIGRNCRFLQGTGTDPDARAQLGAAIRAGEPCTVELLNYRKDGAPFWNELSVSPVRDETGQLTHFIGVQTDITTRRALEEQYRQAQKMDAVGRLAGGIAHDFNNLLTVINGYATLLLKDVPAGAPFRDMIDEVHKAGTRAAGLTRQLLTFSRKAHIEPQVLRLTALVADLEKMLGRIVGEDILLTITDAPGADPVRVDPGLMEQVILNLVVNARDAMPAGGHLTIDVRNVERSEAGAPDRPAGRYVCLSVTDSGCGIDAAIRERIFEPFFSTKGEHGTGLGLATVHGIIKQAGGHVAVSSEVGRGTTMSVFLPRAAEPPLAAQAPRPSAAEPRGTETILLVEDHGPVRALTGHVLRSCGYTVLEAGTGTEAVSYATGHIGRIDLLACDVVMPQMDGREVAQRVTELRPGVKVLFLSGHANDAVARHGVIEAENNFLQKPFRPGALALKVREVLDRTID